MFVLSNLLNVSFTIQVTMVYWSLHPLYNYGKFSSRLQKLDSMKHRYQLQVLWNKTKFQTLNITQNVALYSPWNRKWRNWLNFKRYWLQCNTARRKIWKLQWFEEIVDKELNIDTWVGKTFPSVCIFCQQNPNTLLVHKQENLLFYVANLEQMHELKKLLPKKVTYVWWHYMLLNAMP